MIMITIVTILFLASSDNAVKKNESNPKFDAVFMRSALHGTGMEQLKVIQYLVLLALMVMVLKLE